MNTLVVACRERTGCRGVVPIEGVSNTWKGEDNPGQFRKSFPDEKHTEQIAKRAEGLLCTRVPVTLRWTVH